MDIFTLVKANIRKKKSSFISIVILTAIVVAVVLTVVGVKDNYHKGMTRAFETADVSDVTTFIKAENLTKDLKDKVEKSDLVERVVYYDAICSNGQKVEGYEDGNSAFLMEMREGIMLYNDRRDGFVEDIPKLTKGEIYLPLGLRSKLSCDVGDIITINLIKGVKKEFTIKGFVQEPTQGAMLIGWKQLFISKEDYDLILKECHEIQLNDEEAAEITVDVTCVMIYQNSNNDLSSVLFQRKLNLETGIIDNSLGALNKEQSEHYSMLMADVILNIVFVFALFLFVIILIVMAHSIGTEIEIDYVTLGVLKSQGFSKGKLRQIFMWQYGMAETIGIVIGCILAVPLLKAVGEVCREIIGTLEVSNLVNVTSLILILILIVVTFVLIHISTVKVVEISPVRAISGGKKEIYFNSRFNAPISSRALGASLAFRQFTSGKKRYVGMGLIVAILTFFMVTVNLLGNLLVPENTGEAMGLVIPDIEIYHKKSDVSTEWEELDDLVKEYSDIKYLNSFQAEYVSLNGENLYCEICEIPEAITGILEGREPLYDNEILVTKLVAESLELEIGDKVKVSSDGKEDDYIISGFYQSISDTGMTFSMSGKAMERLKDEKLEFYSRLYVIEDKTKLDAIKERIQEQYGEEFDIEVYTKDNNPILEQFGNIILILKLIINVFSVIFTAVAVRMVCVKTFLQERTDIGIYKAIGFTSTKLRTQFAVRFFIVSLIGAILGIILSVLASTKMLGIILRQMGITKLVLTFTADALILPVLIVSVSCMVFAFLASSKIKKVEVRELVVE